MKIPQEQIFKLHSLNAEQIFYLSQLKVNKLYRQSIIT